VDPLAWAADDRSGIVHAVARGIGCYLAYGLCPAPWTATAICAVVVLAYLYSLAVMRPTGPQRRVRRSHRMTVAVDMGLSPQGTPVTIDLEELLATRLLVQGNSGSGKSHLLRRLLEKSAGQVQQIVIDPEGDFVTLAGPYGHLAIEASEHDEKEIARAALRIREHRASVVLSLEGLEAEGQMRCAAAFLSALFEAPRDHWYPALVVVDEAQLFAPTSGGEVAEEVRRASLSAMTNLMCRGPKRGLAGIIATQRLAKLAKNVAAEASNFLMGRTFLDIDMARAADLSAWSGARPKPSATCRAAPSWHSGLRYRADRSASPSVRWKPAPAR
jgi:hypothetical protein